MTRGRPSTYTDVQGAEIRRRYVEGATLTEIGRMADMPHLSTIYDWLHRYPDFAELIDRARPLHADSTADMCQVVADTEPDAHRAAVRVKVRQWRAAKLRPERYGDTTTIKIDQRISISAALAAADQRLVLPISDRLHGVIGQTIDVTPDFGTAPTDTISDAVRLAPLDVAPDPDDIFG